MGMVVHCVGAGGVGGDGGGVDGLEEVRLG